MKLLACPHCGAQFDVSGFQPGSTFVCGSCQGIVTVPSRPATGAVRRAGGPGSPPPGRRAAGPAAPGSRRGAAPGRAAPGAGTGGVRRRDPRRAGAAAPAPQPAAPPPGRRAAGRATYRRGGYEAAPKSKLPLVLLGGGGLVVVLVVALILALGGKEEQPSGPGAGSAGPGVARSPGDPEHNVQDFLRLPVSKRFELSQKKFLAAGTDLAAHKAAWAWFTARGMSGFAKKSLTYVLEKNAQDDWANEKSGKKNLTGIYKRIPGDELLDTYANQAYDRLIEMKDEGIHWVTPDQYAEAEKDLDAVLDHYKKLTTDRNYLDQWQCIKWVARHPFYSEYKYEIVARTPYMIFVEHTGKESKAQRAEALKIADRDGDIFQQLYTTYLKMYGKRFDLPRLEDMDRPDERILRAWVFFDEKAFHDYHEKYLHRRLPRGVRAYYSPSEQWINLFEGRGFERHSTHGESDFNTNKVFHEGFHQLMHYYTKILIERDQKAKGNDKEILWSDPRCVCQLHWFQEGMAEFMGSTKPIPGQKGKWEMTIPLRNRMVEWKRTMDGKMTEWGFEEMMGIRTGPEMNRKAALKGLANAGRLTSLFYAQAWAFCYFLWNYENGKYRDKLLDYMGKELHGVSGPKVWAETFFGQGKKVDWHPLEKEYRKYFLELCKKVLG